MVRDHLSDLDIDDKRIKLILEKYGVKILIEFSWLYV